MIMCPMINCRSSAICMSSIAKWSGCVHAERIPHLGPPHYVLRISTSRKHDQYMTSIAFNSQLLGVNIFVSEIVGKTRDHCWVCAERLNTQANAKTHSGTVREIICKMVGITSRAAVAADLNRLLIFPGNAKCFYQFCNFVDRWQRKRLS